MKLKTLPFKNTSRLTEVLEDNVKKKNEVLLFILKIECHNYF